MRIWSGWRLSIGLKCKTKLCANGRGAYKTGNDTNKIKTPNVCYNLP